MSFPVTEHIAKREHSVILAEDNHTPPISSKSFSKVIENYSMSDHQPLHTRRMLPNLVSNLPPPNFTIP